MVDELRVTPGTAPGLAVRDTRDDFVPVLETLDPTFPEPEAALEGTVIE